MTLSPGTRLGPYEVNAQIGVGGMGEVYRATDTNLKRSVAIKVLPASVASDAERLARFQREAEILAALNHPNIAQIYQLEKSDGTIALIMELVEGPTLADRITQSAIPIDEALAIAKQIAEALEAAHEQGVIHRDLKPANIKLRPDGVVKVLDFGLAKLTESVGSDQPAAGNRPDTLSPTITSPALATGVGVLLGTAAYMSPEQARGKPVDKRADIWAFGCVLYEMLTGRRAFAGEDITDTVAAVVRSEPKWDALQDVVPPSVRAFLRRCLHKDAKQRVGDIRDVRLALEGAFETATPQDARSSRLAQPSWRRAVPFAMTAVAAVLVTGLAAWRLWPSVEPPAVHRFTYSLPPDQLFRGAGRTVMALSRDGRHFVYNTERGLYLRSMDELQSHVIPGTEKSLTNPFFAPDGQSVGYFEGGSLKRIPISGGSPIVICGATSPFGASWHTDDTILFGQPNGVVRVSANGGTPELVIRAKGGEQVSDPQLLPDGESVLFSATGGSGATRWDSAQIVVQSLSSSARKVVLKGGSDARYFQSGHLVYAVGNTLFAVAFDLGRLEVVGQPVPVAEGIVRAGNPAASSATANYGISDEGTLVHVGLGVSGAGFVTQVPLGTLVWVDRTGREEALAAPPRPYADARLSPDGTRIAVTVRAPGDIWIWDLRRQFMSRFAFDRAQAVTPIWSPDGQRLVWASGVPMNLYWQAADGTGAVERLTESRNPQLPSSFTPDGRRLLLTEGPTGEASQGLAILPLDGNRRVSPLGHTPLSGFNSEISPNGRWLTYESNESGQPQIYVRPFPAVDEGRSQVSTNGGRQPLWARSGRELFYLEPDGTLVGVSVDMVQDNARLTVGRPVKLLEGAGYFSNAEGFRNMGRTYDVSSDGTRFLRIKVAGTSLDASGGPSSLIIVENWLEELKRRVPTN
jgi:serine/threonine-protein kinase